MKIIGYLKKQPNWKAYLVDDKVYTGWSEVHLLYNFKTRGKPILEIDVPILEGTITLDSFGRGRSAATFYFKDETGHEYESGMKSSFEIFMKMNNGSYTGKFTLRKQGQQIYLNLYEEK